MTRYYLEARQRREGRPRPWTGDNDKVVELLLDLKADLIDKVKAWASEKLDDDSPELTPVEEHLAMALERVETLECLIGDEGNLPCVSPEERGA
ncbi:MAG: hypothetical protein AAGF92_14665 [Myxococcota bacterium]